jgi:serine protease Do
VRAQPAPAGLAGPPAPPVPAPFCSGQYADDFSALSAAARDFDQRPEATFSYCTRNAAVYECLSYGSDGAIRRDRRRVVLHGTAFAYRKQGADTLLLTNDHVAAWPAVTDEDHTVDKVPAGCKRISETLTLVDNEHDSYAPDDVAVSRVVTDPALDVAVLKAHGNLQVMPWKIGHSAGIRERNLVEVRGFPLGAFRATNIGKVTSPHDHDDYGDWEHDDFIVDALLSRGNSGSPVLAISCATGEYELVGIYHAGYSEGSALNAVIAIGQVRDLISIVKRSPRDPDRNPVAVDGAARRAIAAQVSGSDIFFPFGAQTALARATGGGGLLYAVFPKEFPAVGDPTIVIEDLPPSDPSSFGQLGRVWLGSSHGLKHYELSAFDADGQAHVKRALTALEADLAARLSYRQAEASAGSRQAEGNVRQLGKQIARAAASRGDLLAALGDLAERLAPQAGERAEHLANLERVSSEAAPPSALSKPVPVSPPGPVTAGATTPAPVVAPPLGTGPAVAKPSGPAPVPVPLARKP